MLLKRSSLYLKISVQPAIKSLRLTQMTQLVSSIRQPFRERYFPLFSLNINSSTWFVLLNINHRSDIYELFIAELGKFCSASISIDVCLPLPEASVANLLKSETK